MGHNRYRRGCVEDSVKWWIGDHGLVESAFLSDVLDNGKVELVGAAVWVRLLDLVCLLL